VKRKFFLSSSFPRKRESRNQEAEKKGYRHKENRVKGFKDSRIQVIRSEALDMQDISCNTSKPKNQILIFNDEGRFTYEW
jgi:hypothetical protein